MKKDCNLLELLEIYKNLTEKQDAVSGNLVKLLKSS